MLIALLSLALQAPPESTPAEARTITVSLADEKGGPVTGLRPDEVAVLENGVARSVSRVEPEARPLTVAVIVDSSEPISGVYRLHVVDSVLRFLGRLPKGTRYAVWTTGDRPTKVVDFTDDVTRADRALKRTFPRGGNTLFDAIVEASEELKAKEDLRTAVVVVSGNGLGFTNYDRNHVVDRGIESGHTFMAVNFQEGAVGNGALGAGDGMGQVNRTDYDFVLGSLADKSGGLHEIPLSSMGVDHALDKVAALLGAQYRITYSTLPDLKDRKVEVKVARPGVKVSLGRSRS